MSRLFKALTRALRKVFRKVRSFIPRPLFTRRNFLIVIIFGLIATGSLVLWAATLELPDLTGVEERKVTQSTKIYDRTGQVLLYDLSQNITRTVVPIDEVSPYVQNATVALEDAEFYTHHGVRPLAFLRAVLANLLSLSFSQGGSTITQQVIKNALLTQDKTPARKIKEWTLALKLERVLTKKQILEIYLNESPYGGSIYGIEEASRAFLGKPAKDVTLAEAAYLAALPQAPTYYSPYGNHRDALDRRKNLALDQMFAHGYITKEEHDAAQKEVVTFAPPRASGIRAPHFVFYVQELLEEKYGARALEEGGMRVITTLDADLQAKGEEIAKKYALENATKYHATNAAIVAIDPRNGEILTMVGSRNYFDTEIPGNYNIALASRQPGSSFKPFVYATAFGKGYTPETVVFDLRTQFSTSCAPTDFSTEAPCYSPQNYDNVFRGPVTLRNALAQSLNIPAVKVLYLAGLRDSLSLAKSMGITTLTDVDRYGLTLVLGGGEVRLIDMVSAYGGFATNGFHNNSTPILRIENAAGEIIDQPSTSGTQVLSEEVAEQINDVLSDNVARTPAFGSDSFLYFPGRDVAVKTGTTNDYRDAWIVGYTPNLVVGAWAGNNDNSPMEKKVAGFIVAPLWHAFMAEALKNRPDEYFTRAEIDTSSYPPVLRGVWQGGNSQLIDTRTNSPASSNTPTEFLSERIEGGVHEILYWVDKNNPTGPRPANPASDPQFTRWEAPVRAWAAAKGLQDGSSIVVPYSGGFSSEQPQVETPSAPAQSSPAFYITNPKNGSTVSNSSPLTVEVAGVELSSVRYYFNGLYIGASSGSPFSMTLVPKALSGRINDSNVIRAVGTLQNGTEITTEINVTVN